MSDSQIKDNNRRPLAVRDMAIAKRIAIWLSQKNITPNQISLMSIGFAIVGYAAMHSYYYFYSSVLLLITALSIQMRLLCNLFDGMVALEGGEKNTCGRII